MNNNSNQNYYNEDKLELATRCEDDFNLLSTIFTDIVYNTIYDIALSKGEIASNIRLEDLYISSLNQFGNEVKKHSIFKKLMIQFMNATYVHTDYKNVSYESSIYRLFNHFIIQNNSAYDFNDQVKFLNTIFFNTYSKFVKKIIKNYVKIILFDRQNIEYHQKLQKVYYDILINEKKIFYSPAPTQYNEEINMIQLINDFSLLKEKYIKQNAELKKCHNELKILSDNKENDEKNEYIINKLKNDNDNYKKHIEMLHNKIKQYDTALKNKINELELLKKNINKPLISKNKTLSTKNKTSTKSRSKNILLNNSNENSDNDNADDNDDNTDNTDSNTNTNFSNKYDAIVGNIIELKNNNTNTNNNLNNNLNNDLNNDLNNSINDDLNDSINENINMGKLNMSVDTNNLNSDINLDITTNTNDTIFNIKYDENKKNNKLDKNNLLNNNILIDDSDVSDSDDDSVFLFSN